MNLLFDRWIPVVRKSGVREKIAPVDLTSDHDNDPITDLAAARYDFNTAAAQFLIGLFQTATPTSIESGVQIPWLSKQSFAVDWQNWLINPPDRGELEERFTVLRPAFEFTGKRPLFLQDFELQEEKELEKSISNLLFEQPRKNTLKHNSDLFVKRNRVNILCQSCTALALMNLQACASGDGRGYVTSLRGGGPLTTILVFDPVGGGLERTLFRDIWLNILDIENIEALPGNSGLTNLPDILPWMAAPRISERNRGGSTYPQDVHPLQAYWGQPRRILINWGQSDGAYCDVCDDEARIYSSSLFEKIHGTDYQGAWQHPLSPHHIKKDGTLKPVKSQPHRLGFQYWPLITGDLAAEVIRCFGSYRRPPGIQVRIWAFGADMDKAKAHSWVESTMPLITVPQDQRALFLHYCEQMADTSEQAANELIGSLKKAWFRKAPSSFISLNAVKDEFFRKVESTYYDCIGQLEKNIKNQETIDFILERWWRSIRDECLSLFDMWVLHSEFNLANPQRITEARSYLIRQLHGKLKKQLVAKV